VNACHGSPETQNFEDALAHAQSGKPLACAGAQQMSAMRERYSLAYCVSIVRLLPRATGVNARGQIAVALALSAT